VVRAVKLRIAIATLLAASAAANMPASAATGSDAPATAAAG
jgi:hypothetical protein